MRVAGRRAVRVPRHIRGELWRPPVKKLKIAIHTVAKNEKANVREWMHSARDADHVLLVDTGSDDGTPYAFIQASNLMEGSRAKFECKRITVNPWRFDVARNCALALLPPDIDVVLTLDMDERLNEGWREALEKAWVPGTTQASYRYIFARNPDGSVAMEFDQVRCHSRNNFYWFLPAHEGPYPYLLESQSRVHVAGMVIEQKQDLSKNRMDRDLVLAELGYRENPLNQRAIFYHARQLYYAQRYADAIELFEKYFSLGPTFPWQDEQAALHLGYCQAAMK